MRQNDSYLYQYTNRSKSLGISSENFGDTVVKPYKHVHLHSDNIMCLSNICGSKIQGNQSILSSVDRLGGQTSSQPTKGKCIIGSSSNSFVSMPKFTHSASLSITGYRSECLDCKAESSNISSRSSSDVLQRITATGPSQLTATRSSFKTVPCRWKTRPSRVVSAYGFPDPLVGGSKMFMQRIAEMTSYEAETIKYEKMKRAKKKKDSTPYV